MGQANEPTMSELAIARARDGAAWAASELPRKLDDLCLLTDPATFYQHSHPKALGGNDTEVFTIELAQRDLEDEGRVVAATFRVTDPQTKEWSEVQFWERLKGGWNAYVDGQKHRTIIENIPEFIDREMDMPGRETRATLRNGGAIGIISTRETDLRSLSSEAPALRF